MGSTVKQIMENMGSQIEIYVTAACTDKHTGLFNFWTQLDPDGLNEIEEQAEKFQLMAQVAGSPLPHDKVEVGELCIAKYLEDGRWYRARIDNVTGNDVIAFFIDYGNTEIIPRSLVRTEKSVEKSVFTLPAQATECVIAGISAVIQHNQVKMGTQVYLKNMLVDETFIGEPQQLTDYGKYILSFCFGPLLAQTAQNFGLFPYATLARMIRPFVCYSITNARKHHYEKPVIA